jgi:uncharacterized protein (UPF0332 family)
MPRSRPSIADLLAADRLEEIEPDDEEASELLGHAQAHLASAQRLVETDPAGAYQLLYDAARKAASADMLANGYRAKDRPGAHAAVVLYAEETFSAQAEAVENFDRMRRNRNRTEYRALTLNKTQIEADLDHARAIVTTVQGRLGPPTSR